MHHQIKLQPVSTMHCFMVVLAMLCSFLALVSGNCKPHPAPDGLFDIPYRPSEKGESETFTGTQGCEISVPFDKPRIHPCPGNQGFDV